MSDSTGLVLTDPSADPALNVAAGSPSCSTPVHLRSKFHDLETMDTGRKRSVVKRKKKVVGVANSPSVGALASPEAPQTPLASCTPAPGTPIVGTPLLGPSAPGPVPLSSSLRSRRSDAGATLPHANAAAAASSANSASASASGNSSAQESIHVMSLNNPLPLSLALPPLSAPLPSAAPGSPSIFGNSGKPGGLFSTLPVGASPRVGGLTSRGSFSLMSPTAPGSPVIRGTPYSAHPAASPARGPTPLSLSTDPAAAPAPAAGSSSAASGAAAGATSASTTGPGAGAGAGAGTGAGVGMSIGISAGAGLSSGPGSPQVMSPSTRSRRARPRGSMSMSGFAPASSGEADSFPEAAADASGSIAPTPMMLPSSSYSATGSALASSSLSPTSSSSSAAGGFVASSSAGLPTAAAATAAATAAPGTPRMSKAETNAAAMGAVAIGPAPATATVAMLSNSSLSSSDRAASSSSLGGATLLQNTPMITISDSGADVHRSRYTITVPPHSAIDSLKQALASAPHAAASAAVAAAIGADRPEEVRWEGTMRRSSRQVRRVQVVRFALPPSPSRALQSKVPNSFAPNTHSGMMTLDVRDTAPLPLEEDPTLTPSSSFHGTFDPNAPRPAAPARVIRPGAVVPSLAAGGEVTVVPGTFVPEGESLEQATQAARTRFARTLVRPLDHYCNVDSIGRSRRSSVLTGTVALPLPYSASGIASTSVIPVGTPPALAGQPSATLPPGAEERERLRTARASVTGVGPVSVLRMSAFSASAPADGVTAEALAAAASAAASRPRPMVLRPVIVNPYPAPVVARVKNDIALLERNVQAVMARMRQGCYVYKFKDFKPTRRFIYLSADGQSLCWRALSSKEERSMRALDEMEEQQKPVAEGAAVVKEGSWLFGRSVKTVSLADVILLYYGPYFGKGFSVFVRGCDSALSKAWHSLSVETTGETLNLVFPSLADATLWALGIQWLAPANFRSFSMGKLLWMRVIMKINFIGFANFVRNKNKDWTSLVNRPGIIDKNELGRI